MEEKKRQTQEVERERERESVGGKKVVVVGGEVRQCDIQSSDESQHKKLKAAVEISRLISIQIRHKFYMASV